METQKKVRLSLEVSPQLNETLERLANETHVSKSDLLRRAIALMEVAVEAKQKGRKIGIAQPDQELQTEFVGL